MSPLTPKEAHVWTLLVTENDQKNIHKFSHVLSAEELCRLDQINHKQSKLEYQAAHILCRIMLSNFSDVAPADWLFKIGEHGKPEINKKLNRKNLRFNISHTNGMVACALTTKYDIGVDLEWPSRNSQMYKIAEKKFSDIEFNYFKASSPTEQSKIFFSLWTLKESYLKAVGKGLRIPLDSFSFDLNTLEISFLDNNAFHNTGYWKFALFRPSVAHLCALCVAHPKNSPKKIKYQQVYWQDLAGHINANYTTKKIDSCL